MGIAIPKLSMSKKFIITLTLVLGVFAPLVAPIAQNKASASHACYVWLFENEWYNWYQAGVNRLYFCPFANETRSYTLASEGMWKTTSSLVIHIPAWCIFVTLRDDQGNIFGGPNGLHSAGSWEIASLVPYGWNDKMVYLQIDNYCT